MSIRSSLEDGILSLVIDRPQRKNALDLAMYRALVAGLDQATADPAVRVVTITGAGGVFTSGNDLADFQANPPTPEGGPVIDFLDRLVRFEKPLLAGVEGPAVGSGVTMLLHCDLVYAADTARMRLPFVNLGLVPEAGSSFLLPLVCGHVRASELLLLGGDFGAAKALELGLINAVVSPAELPATLAAAANRLADQPLGSLIATKRLIKAPQRAALEAAMRAEGAEFFERLSSPEAMEAFISFFEKRKPNFRQIQ